MAAWENNECRSRGCRVDIAQDAIAELREIYGMKNIYYCDAQDLSALRKGSFDVIIAGELLEHLSCPGSFLESVYPVLRDTGSLIITTTNAFCARKFLQIIFNRESIHEDHVSYFSHRTLQRLAELYSYQVIEQSAYRLYNKRPLLPYIVERIACMFSPNIGEGIICRMKKESKEGR